MTSGRMDEAYTVSVIVVDADTMRHGASEFKRVEGAPPAPWSKVLETAKTIKEHKAGTKCSTCRMNATLLYDEECVGGIECSECGWSEKHNPEDFMPKYCPNCGAKVEVGDVSV